jgi:predicted GNAT family N-acyltransferase
MLISIESFSSDDTDKMQDAYSIRNTVFVEEQHVPKHIEYDTLDSKCVHYVVYWDEIPCTTVRWRETEEGIKLERFAVLKKYRGKSLAALLLKIVLDELLKSKKKIYLHSQDSAAEFYKRYGFFVEGDSFTEADIVHYKMVYKK